MQVLFSKQFRKKMRTLRTSVQDSFWERLSMFLEDTRHPLLHDHALTGDWIGCRSINVTGSYRAIYRPEKGDFVHFIAIGTHPELYGR